MATAAAATHGHPDRVAALLHQAFIRHERLMNLPSELAPRTRGEAYLAQRRLADLTAQPTVGWKIAATSDAGQRHINVAGPLGGRILSDRTYADQDTVSLSGNAMCLAELEFVFVMSSSIEPRDKPYTVDEVHEAVAELRMGIELPSTRYIDPTTVGELNLIADNACSGDFVLGPAADDVWRSVDLSTVEVRIDIDRPEEHRSAQGIGSNVLGHPLIALTWMVNELSGLAITLEAGMFVTTGTCCTPIEVGPMDTITARFAALGQTTCSFS